MPQCLDTIKYTSLRVRADLRFGDPWAPDPGCYLTDDEIGLDEDKQAELVRSREVFHVRS